MIKTKPVVTHAQNYIDAYIDAPNPTSFNISHPNIIRFIPNKQKILFTLV